MDEREQTILLIDDDAILRRGLAIYLSDSGYVTIEAENGTAGLERCRESAPDLVLCDLRMPGIDGLDVLGSLVRSNPALPVIIFTGQGVLQDAIAALRRGAWDFLTKPILDYDILDLAIRRALERSRILSENEQYRLHLEEEVERKTADYRASEERLQAVLDALHGSFLLLFNEDGTVAEAPAARELQTRHGVTLEQLATGEFAEMFSEKARQKHEDIVRDVFRTGTPVSGTVRVKFPQGVIWLDCSYSPLRAPDGTVMRVLGFARDVTERRLAEIEAGRLEAQLRQSQKMEALGTLAGGIAHDFNNMLAVILGFCDIAMADTSGRTTANALREINTAGRRAAELVKQILTFSRRSDVERGPLELAPVVKEALRLLRSSLPASIELTQDIGRVGSVLANPGQVHQIILNLGSNAYHAMRSQENGRLAVSLGIAHRDDLARFAVPLGDYVHLRFEDSGPGIAPDIAEHVFEPFFTTKAVGEGTGMGLAIVHGIVSQYGGAIRLESPPEGGAAFDIFLPRLPSDAPKAVPHSGDVPRGSGNILVVDDEPACMVVAQLLLEDCGYSVTPYTNSIDALACFRAAPDSFDMLVTDQVMPQLSGLSLARAVQLLRPGVPVLLVSGAADLPEGDEAYANTGVRECLPKPLDTNALAEAVLRVLQDDRINSTPTNQR